MEPGHEDREYALMIDFYQRYYSASMEPGHEDREYGYGLKKLSNKIGDASMEPGHEDREYRSGARRTSDVSCCLNGARS